MKIEFECTVVTAAVKLLVLPGDRVLMHNGLLLGLAPKPQDAAPPAVELPTKNQVLSILKDFPSGLTTREVSNELKLPPGEAVRRAKVGELLRKLAIDLTLEQDFSLSTRYPKFRLAKEVDLSP